MSDHVSGKSIVITGGGGGFGRLVAHKAAARSAKVTLGDITVRAAGDHFIL
jgi:NAD(P)-dependent dehydrogenase (short-subunit alcohol dehydrogenase family)